MHKSSFARENIFVYIMVPYLSKVSRVTHKICWILMIFIYFIKSWSFVLFFQRVRITTQSAILVSTVFALVLFILSFLKELIVNYFSPFLSKRRKTKISIIEFKKENGASKIRSHERATWSWPSLLTKNYWWSQCFPLSLPCSQLLQIVTWCKWFCWT